MCQWLIRSTMADHGSGIKISIRLTEMWIENTRGETFHQSEIMWNAVEPERYSWTEQKGMMDFCYSSYT